MAELWETVLLSLAMIINNVSFDQLPPVYMHATFTMLNSGLWSPPLIRFPLDTCRNSNNRLTLPEKYKISLCIQAIMNITTLWITFYSPTALFTGCGISTTTHIHGPNLESLNSKTVSHLGCPTSTPPDSLSAEMLSAHGKVTLCLNIMFVNKIMFLVTVSKDI